MHKFHSFYFEILTYLLKKAEWLENFILNAYLRQRVHVVIEFETEKKKSENANEIAKTNIDSFHILMQH